MASIQGKVIIVTGATSGIGKSLVEVFAAKGAKVVFSGRRADKGKEVEEAVKKAKGEATFVQGDVTSTADVEKLAKTAESKYGGLDIFVNNAGVEGELNLLSDPASLKTFDFVFDVNVKGIIRGYQVATPLLTKRGGGLIINISSVAAELPFPKFGVYAASKAAVDALTRVGSAELEASKIRVYSLNPYVFESEMADRASGNNVDAFASNFNPSGKAGKGSDLAEFIAELFDHKHDKQYPSGSSIAIEHGNANWPASEVLPKFVAALAAAAAKK